MGAFAFAPLGKHRVLVAVSTAVAAFALAAAVLGRSCQWNKSEPEEIVGQFIAAIKERDREAIFRLLSSGTQARLEAQAGKATGLVGGSRRYDALDLISVSELDRATPVQIGRAVIAGSNAIVPIATETGRSELALVREGNAWRVDISAYQMTGDVSAPRRP